MIRFNLPGLSISRVGVPSFLQKSLRRSKDRYSSHVATFKLLPNPVNSATSLQERHDNTLNSITNMLIPSRVGNACVLQIHRLLDFCGVACQMVRA